MLISYYTDLISQSFLNKKTLLFKTFSSRNLQTGHDIVDGSYISRCTPFEQDIAALFLRFHKAPNIFLTNKYIAGLVGCSTRTVIRATNKFHKDGFITKHQPDKYSPNYYTLNDSIKKGSFRFMHWLNSLSDYQQNIYITHGINIDHKNKKVCSDVTPNKSTLLLDSLSSNLSPLTRARARGDGGILNTKKGELVNEFQKKWILAHPTDPRVKGMMENPRIKKALIIPDIEKIAQLVGLDEHEQLKLIVFEEKALKYAASYIESIVLGRKNISNPVNDVMGWIISLLMRYSAEHKCTVDWRWYYQVCEIIGKDVKTPSPRKPLCIPKVKITSGIYKPWKRKQSTLSLDQQITSVRESIVVFEKQVANPHEFWDSKNILFSVNVAMTQSLLTKAKEKLQELENQKKDHDEKQIIPSQYSSHLLETSCA